MSNEEKSSANEVTEELEAQNATATTEDENTVPTEQAVQDAPADREVVLSAQPTYRWTYDEQRTYDRGRRSRRGGLTYAIVMALAFALTFALLVGVLIWYGEPIFDPAEQGTENTVAAAVSAKVTPSTVLIYCEKSDTYSYGTGFFVRSDGYIVTNYHVVRGFRSLEIYTYDGLTLDASLVSYSRGDDLAVLKVEGSDFPAVTIGNSDELTVGETTVAIGNPGGTNAPWSTTQGIVSALGRTVVVNDEELVHEMTMIQTDTAVNGGNSGGPLCNARGEVIGIITSKMTDYEGADYEGIGLALPINEAMEIVEVLIRDRSNANVQSRMTRTRPTFEISGYSIKKGEQFSYDGIRHTAPYDGVAVTEVIKGTNAYGKIEVADIIFSIDDRAVTSMEEFIDLLHEYPVGKMVKVGVIRNGTAVAVMVMLGQR